MAIGKRLKSKTQVLAGGSLLGAIAGFAIWVAFSYQPFSRLTGGQGQVVRGGAPVAGATVMITDSGGRLVATTDDNGYFDVAMKSDRILYLSPANPLKHDVAVRVEKDGVVLTEWKFVKGQLGPNYFDFGVMDANGPAWQLMQVEAASRLGLTQSLGPIDG